MEQHKHLINEYEKVLTELNPEFAEREQQKNEIKIIKDQMNTMSQNMVALMSAQKELIERLNRKET